MQDKMIAFCGIVCTGCRAFIATQTNDMVLKKKVARAWSTKKEPLKPEDIDCDGCLAIGRRLHSFCATCEVRRCGHERGAENCAYCREYPCVKLTGLWKKLRTTTAELTLKEIRRGLKA
jgi:hypothetical protein